MGMGSTASPPPRACGGEGQGEGGIVSYAEPPLPEAAERGEPVQSDRMNILLGLRQASIGTPCCLLLAAVGPKADSLRAEWFPGAVRLLLLKADVVLLRSSKAGRVQGLFRTLWSPRRPRTTEPLR